MFGFHRHRNALQKQFPNISLHIGQYKSFVEFGDVYSGNLPGIADVYNDEGDVFPKFDRDCPYKSRLNDVFEMKKRDKFQTTNAGELLVHWCCEIARLQVQKWGGKIHFLLDDDWEMGIGTETELKYILKRWELFKKNVIFYRFGKRCRAPLDRHLKNPIKSDNVKKLTEGHETFEYVERFMLTKPFYEGREKSADSCYQKLYERKIPVLDRFGYRVPYYDEEELLELVAKQHKKGDHNASVTWLAGNVVYFYFNIFEPPIYLERFETEVQLWPFAALHYFYKDITENSDDETRKRRKILAISDQRVINSFNKK